MKPVYVRLKRMATFISHSPQETESLGESWGRTLPAGSVVGLSGDLGAGKTQLVKGLARGLGFSGRGQAPTFALLNEYRGGRLTLFHIDLYRLDTPEQIIGAGLEPYLYQPQGIAVVEWIERWAGQAVPSPSQTGETPQGLLSKSSFIRHVSIKSRSET